GDVRGLKRVGQRGRVVHHVEPLLPARARLDLHELLGEEAGDAAAQALAAPRDHGVGTELGTDAREDLLERPAAERARGAAHGPAAATASTRRPGAISL